MTRIYPLTRPNYSICAKVQKNITYPIIYGVDNIIPKTIFRVFQNETGKSNRKNAKTKWCNSAARTQIKTALKYLLNGIQMLFIETDYYSFLS